MKWFEKDNWYEYMERGLTKEEWKEVLTAIAESDSDDEIWEDEDEPY